MRPGWSEGIKERKDIIGLACIAYFIGKNLNMHGLLSGGLLRSNYPFSTSNSLVHASTGNALLVSSPPIVLALEESCLQLSTT
jgi:hypothetical protein